MKRITSLLAVLTFALAIFGCQTNKTRVAEGAGIGGLVGATAGGIIGHQSGHGVGGALIGGVIGAAGGAAVGSQIEKPQAKTQGPTRLSMDNIVEFSKQGISSDEIISKIKATNSKYVLTAEDIDYLRKQGVSQRVIEAMQGL